jgi:plastocyanin
MKVLAALLAVSAALGCSGAGGSGTPGTGGMGGGDPSFMAVAPCTTEAGYTTSGTTIQFGVSGFTYTPNCLKVPAGSTVTFSGDFASHPLTPSALRGTMTGNPISPTGIGTTATFTFLDGGFWAYYCSVHGSDADGQFMSGVVWVK